MGNITPQYVQPLPLWDSNTDEVVSGLIAENGKHDYSVPDHCYCIIVSANLPSNGPCFLTPNDAGNTTGQSFNNDGSDSSVTMFVTVGQRLDIFNDNSTSLIFNIVQFFNKP